jgi:hypothetical protein
MIVEAELIRPGRAIRFGKPAAIDIRSPSGSVLLVLALMALAGINPPFRAAARNGRRVKAMGQVKIPGAQTSPDVLPGRGRRQGCRIQCTLSCDPTKVGRPSVCFRSLSAWAGAVAPDFSSISASRSHAVGSILRRPLPMLIADRSPRGQPPKAADLSGET